VAAVHMEPFSTHPAATPGGPGATLWGHSRQQPLQGRSQGVLGACGGSLSPQDSTHMVGAGGSCTHGTFLHPPCCHTRRPWGDPVGAQQAAAPPGEVSRSAGSLWGQSEPTGFNAYGGGRWQLYTWNLSPPTLLPHQAALGRPCGGTAGSSPSRGGLKECWEPVGAV
jgi:hypothetical protein